MWRLRRGSQDALGQIYEKYRIDLLTLAVHFLGDPAAAEDVVQDVFLILVRSARTLRLRKSLKGFLLTCVANRARDLLRKGRRQKVRSMDCTEQMATDGMDPVQLVEQNDQTKRLQAALAQLPSEQQEIVALRVHGHMTFREIAGLYDLSPKTVQSRYRYGLDKLRSLMNSELEQ